MPALLLAVLCLAGASSPLLPPALAAEPIPPAFAAAGRTLADSPVEQAILSALAERRVNIAGATLEISGMSARGVIPASAALAIDRLAYQPAGQRFTAVLTAAVDGRTVQRFTVAGRLRQEIQVPVLNRRLQAGEVITGADLQWASVADRGLPANAVYEPQELIGRTSRRSLAAGAPILAADLKRPVVIAKGALVMLTLNSGSMRLTARGRAIDEGGIGETIRVANAQSRTVVAGVVIANGQVAVDLAPPVSSR